MEPSDLLNRFAFHPANTDEKREAHEEVRRICHEVAIELTDLVPDGREKALVVTKLEEAMFWANAGIARISEPEDNDGR